MSKTWQFKGTVEAWVSVVAETEEYAMELALDGSFTNVSIGHVEVDVNSATELDY